MVVAALRLLLSSALLRLLQNGSLRLAHHLLLLAVLHPLLLELALLPRTTLLLRLCSRQRCLRPLLLWWRRGLGRRWLGRRRRGRGRGRRGWGRRRGWRRRGRRRRVAGPAIGRWRWRRLVVHLRRGRGLLRRPGTEIELRLVRWWRAGWRRRRGPRVVRRRRHPAVRRLLRRRRVRIHLRRVAALWWWPRRRMLLRRRVWPVRRHRAAARVSWNPSPRTHTPRPRPLLAPPSPPPSPPPQKPLPLRVRGHWRLFYQMSRSTRRRAGARGSRRLGDWARSRRKQGAMGISREPVILPGFFVQGLNEFG